MASVNLPLYYVKVGTIFKKVRDYFSLAKLSVSVPYVLTILMYSLNHNRFHPWTSIALRNRIPTNNTQFNNFLPSFHSPWTKLYKKLTDIIYIIRDNVILIWFIRNSKEKKKIKYENVFFFPVRISLDLFDLVSLRLLKICILLERFHLRFYMILLQVQQNKKSQQ